MAAEQALALAAELGLPEPVAALGFRGGARCSLGEREGLEDMRSSARARGRTGTGAHGRQSCTTTSRISTWQFEGPAAALAACREGIDFCERRGIAEYGLSITGMSATMLAGLGLTGGGTGRRRAGGGTSGSGGRHLLQRAAFDGASPARRAWPARRCRWCGRVRGDGARRRQSAGVRPRFHGRGTPAAGPRSPEAGERPAGRSSRSCRRSRGGLLRRVFARGGPDCARTRGSGLAARLVDGVEPVAPLFEHALAAAHSQLAETEGKHAEAVSAVRRGGRALARVRERPRARLRPSGPGTMPDLHRRPRGGGVTAGGA